VEEVQACQRAKMRVVKVDANTQFITQSIRERKRNANYGDEWDERC
jgi:hypothetical protein